jgi:hypothetical protein
MNVCNGSAQCAMKPQRMPKRRSNRLRGQCWKHTHGSGFSAVAIARTGYRETIFRRAKIR